MYVMTSEFGAASQLEKIDMLDFADLVVVNKFEKRGGEDAVRDVRKQVQRNRNAFDQPPEDMPVFGTIASKFNDDGVTALYHALLDAMQEKTGWPSNPACQREPRQSTSSKTIIIPPGAHPLSFRNRRNGARLPPATPTGQADALRRAWHLEETAQDLLGESETATDAGC
jgi:methylmalonyl-CoA mutase